MKIIVLVKEVPDPEGVYALDSEGNVLSDDLPRILSVFDENALEAAVQLKEEQSAVVTALCYGRPDSDKCLIHTLAMGADEAVLIEDAAIGERDGTATAIVLATAIRRLGGADLVLTGRESSDSGNGVVGPLVSQLLDMPFLTLVVKLEVDAEHLRITRLAEGGYDVFGATPPILLTVSNQMNYPRYPSVLKFLQAKKKSVLRWPVADLGVDLSSGLGGRPRVMRRYQPTSLGNCRFPEGDTIEARVAGLARMLREEV